MSAERQPLSHEIIHKELDLIQAIVNRMAANSFQVKAWMMGLFSALVLVGKDALFTQVANDKLLSVGMSILLFAPILCFWYLDAFFLRTEQLYREVYKWVVQNRPTTNAYLYDLNTFKRTDANGETTNLWGKIPNVGRVMASKTLLVFYILPLGLAGALLLFNLLRQYPN